MGKQIFKYFISLLLIVSSSTAYAQEVDTLEADFTPTGVRLGIDAFGIGYSLIDENYSSTLIVADVDFYRYFLVGEFGQYERTRSGEIGQYHTQGTYWRLGADINLFRNDPDKSVLSVGFRYGNSSFNDQLTTTLSSDVYGNPVVTFQNENVNADWYEVVAGLKVAVWKLWLGYNLRLKLGIDTFNDMTFAPYEVPGYGLAAEKDYWEFNYYIMYRISWK